MGLFGLGKKDKILDLSKNFNKEGEESRDEFVDLSNSNNEEEYVNINDPAEKKKRFAKRFADMIEKIDNLSTKIYHLENRLEVLEKKLRINNFKSE